MSDHEHWWMEDGPELRWYHVLYVLIAAIALVGLELSVLWLMGDLV